MSDAASDWMQDREQKLREDVTERLRGVCSGWSEEDFKAVVEKIVRTSARYFYRPILNDTR